MLAPSAPLERQVGFVAVAGDEIVGLEAIGRPEIFADQFEGLVRSYAVDAIDAALGERERERALPAPRLARGLPGGARTRAGPARALARRWETISASRARTWPAARWSRVR